MAFVQLAEGELHYQLDGPAEAPVLVLSNSLGTDLHMWDIQVPAFTQHFRVLRLDTRGHGKSLVTPGPYSIEQLGRDVIALLDALGIARAHFCGLSMGGLIGQWLGINAGQRLHRLVVCNTAARIGTPEVWNPRIETVLRDGAAAMGPCAMRRLHAGSPLISQPPTRTRPSRLPICWRPHRPRVTPPTARPCVTPTCVANWPGSKCRPW